LPRAAALGAWAPASGAGAGGVFLGAAVPRKTLGAWPTFPGSLSRLAFAEDSRHLALGLSCGPTYILRLSPPAPRSPAVLAVTTPEPDVKVFINGREKLAIDAKKTGKIELSPGQHLLSIRDGKTELFRHGFTAKAGDELKVAATWAPRPPKDFNPLDKLDAAQIPAEERLDWQPKELVAILGSHGQRHLAPVTGVAYSPDGKLIASASHEG